MYAVNDQVRMRRPLVCTLFNAQLERERVCTWMAAVLTSRLARSATHCPTSFLRACCMRPSRHHHTFVSSNTCRNVKFPSGAHLVRGRYLTSSSLCPSSDVGTRSSLFFPRRAVLYVPASDGRKVQKVVSVAVDSIVFDLEDGVAANKKVCMVGVLLSFIIVFLFIIFSIFSFSAYFFS